MNLVFGTLAAFLALGKAQEFSACDPIVPENCMFPFPNNFFLRADSSLPSGSRVRLPPESVPQDLSGETFDTSEWESMDGFSPMPGILSYLPDLDDGNLPHHWEMEKSVMADCPTLLIDATTREIIPHFAELDYISGTRKQALFIWPSRRLEDTRRYIVAHRFMYNKNGSLIKPSSAFQALRDRIPTDDYDIEGRRDVFEEIFTILSRVGVRREDVQLAWDFTTASRQNLNGRMLAARDDALSRLPKGGPAYKVNRVEDNYSENIYRLIEGEYTVPYYLSSMIPGSHLVLDEEQKPIYQGETQATFTVLIPRSVVESGKPGAILSYGHGLLGGQGEVKTGYLQEFSNKNGYVLCATDWVGMAGPDTVAIALMLLRNLGEFRMIPDRLVQGVLNHLLLMRLMIGDFAKDPAYTVFNGIPAIDVNRRYYYGNSQGGIMGANYMAFSTDVERGVLGVSGAPYGLLLARSRDFTPFFIGLKVRYPDPFDRCLVISMMAMLWDRSEPSGPLNSITSNPLPGTPVKRVIMQYGLYDSQVHYLGAYMKIRSLGAKFFVNQPGENNETLYDFDYASGSSVSEGSIAVGFDFGAPPMPRENVPPEGEYDSHEKVRRDARSQEQMDIFFKTGVIVDTCDGQGCYGFKSATKMTKEQEYKYLSPGDIFQL